MSLIVQKFGGSSVADAERVFNVAGLVTDTYKAGNGYAAYQRRTNFDLAVGDGH